MFSGIVNPSTGKLEWVQQSEDVSSEAADISHELARSQYGDMLLDKQRNCLYQRGLEQAVEQVKASGREPHVLDIGTGTGLLAMMAARAGAKTVTACEVLRPMVRIARQVISRNGFSEVIRIVPKRSTEMTTEDIGCRANILVTEVFDTELIGEGAIVTFAHAHKHLLEPDSVVVPSLSRMFIRLVESDFLWQANKLLPDKFPVEVKVPAGWAECAGCPSVRDCHVEEVKVPDRMKLLSDSVEIARFNFSDPALSPDCSFPPVEFNVTSSGRSHGLIVWWDMLLGDSVLSMEPWEYPQWRDHWLQAVYLWPQPVQVQKGDLLKVGLCHDDYSIWFSIEHQSSSVVPVERPICTCGLHTSCSRYRVYTYNNSQRNEALLRVFSKVLLGKSVVVCVGDGCLLPLLLLQLKRERSNLDLPDHYYVLTSCSHSCALVKELLEFNGFSSSVTFLEKGHDQVCPEDFGSRPVDAVVAEPFFTSSLLPWHNLHYWYAVESVKKFLAAGVAGDSSLYPGSASLMAVAVKFEDLYSMRSPVGFVEGFDIAPFDQVVGKHLTTPEGIEAEPHPLWEYHSYPCSKIHKLMTFDFCETLRKKSVYEADGEMALELSRSCNGVVLWMDYKFQEDTVLSTGLLSQNEIRAEVMLQWDPGFKQAVYFLAPKYTGQSLSKLGYHVEFSGGSGNVDMVFTGVNSSD